MQNNQIDLSGFEHPVIVQPGIDGWMRDLNTAAYLLVDTPAGEEERLVVMGNDINNGAYQDFAVLPGYTYELKYKLAFGGSGTMNLKVNEGATTIASDSKTTNGSYTLNFTPTASTVRVHYAGNVKFMLNYIQLEYSHTDTIVTVSFPVAGYRYGYQSSENDDEVKGAGNSYTTFYRQLDPRLGRWLSPDPKALELPWQSTYCSMDNNPILYNDPLGDKVKIQEKGAKKRDFKRMIREARKQSMGFDEWYKQRKNEAKTNFLRLTDDGQINTPTLFLSPKYRDITTGNAGTIVSIDPISGRETGVVNPSNEQGGYYFPILDRVDGKTFTKRRESDTHSSSHPNLFPGFRFNRETETYQAQINLDFVGLVQISGYTAPSGFGGSTVNIDITDGNGILLANISERHFRLPDAPFSGQSFTPVLVNTTTTKIFIEVTAVSETKRANWGVTTMQSKARVSDRWKFKPSRLFKRERLINLF